jgi:AcrR family transcriptional regulator
MKTSLIQNAAIYVLEHGLADESIRTIAQGIGTSHRMINYHFGSSDGFWEALINEIRRIEVEKSKRYFSEPHAQPAHEISRAWAHFSTPEYQKVFRIIFEVYVKVLRAPREHETFVRSFVDEWINLLADSFGQHYQMQASEARQYARLRLACIRGLMLDLLLTQETDSIAQAAQLFDEMVASQLERRSVV